MARKPLTFALLALLTFTVMPAYGQETAPTGRFDWARSIHTGSTLSCIRSMATDPEGNLYALVYAGSDGRFTADAGGDGQSLMPAEANGQGGQGCIVALLKISPQGDLLWEKAIKNGWGGHAEPANMRLLGDTAVACMVTFGLAWDHGNWLYYIDTMIRDREGNPVEWGDFQSQFVTAWLGFDLDGNLKESHFLRLSYVDSLGNDIVHPTTGDKYCDYLRYVTFDVAADGSIYIIHFPTSRIDDNHTAEDGGIHSTRVWVDNRLVGTMPAHPLVYQPQLLKLAPNFDTLLAQRYVVQSYDVDTAFGYPSVVFYQFLGRIHVSPDGSIYWPATIDARGIHSVTFDQQPEYTLQTEMRAAGQMDFMCGLLFKFDSSLNMQYIFHLDDAVINPSRWFNNSYFHDVTFDTDSGLVFVHASATHRTAYDTTSTNSLFSYDGDTLTNLDGAFFMALREEDDHPVLHSYGMLPASKSYHHTGDTWDSWSNDKIAVGNNRVFAQACYFYKLYLPNQTAQQPNSSSKGLCLAVYDYAGHCLYGIDYGSTSPDSGPAGVLLRDSVLYLTNDLYGEAHFGTHGGYYSGHNATIARYVDTAFMSTYIYTGDTGEVRITLVDDGTALVAYPNPFRQSVRIKVQGGQLKEHNGTVTAILTDLTGRREEVRLTPDGYNQYTLDLTSRPQATYLLTLTTADGRQHTVRLLKQSDIFGN